MLIGMISCRVIKNVVVGEEEIKLGVEKGSDLVPSDSSFEGGIYDKLYGSKTMFVVKYGTRYGPEG